MQAPPERLAAFVAEFPAERGPIAAFLASEAAALDAGARVLDVGAGDAPYRELFAHTGYVTTDWQHSVHEGAAAADIRAPADAIPRPDGSFDCVVLTQVLEHIPEPAAVLTECFRLLRRGGVLLISVPLAWELHEVPRDYYRYTAFGLEHLLATAGFTVEVLAPRGSTLVTLGALAMNASWAAHLDPEVPLETSAELHDIARRLGELDHPRLDALPLGYQARARRPL